MTWVWLAVAAAVIALGVGIVWALRDSAPVRRGDQIDLETLEATLDGAGLESDKIPDPAILQPHISEADEFLAAVQAKRGNKRIVLIALGDRLVAGEATLGAMGAEVITLNWNEIDGVDQSFDIGGELRFETRSESYVYTHLPRSQTREFAEVAADRVDDAGAA